MALLHKRVAEYPGMLAEGGVGFWEAFQLIPVGEVLQFSQTEFRVYPVRHHAPNSAFSLHLPGQFFYSGDTRPIPELINHKVTSGEIIFHDASVVGNPSHTGLDDLLASYSPEVIERMYVYHYACDSDREAFHQKGIKTVLPGDSFQLPLVKLS